MTDVPAIGNQDQGDEERVSAGEQTLRMDNEWSKVEAKQTTLRVCR